jgi:hypothetical protein
MSSLDEKAVSIYDVYVIVCEYMKQGKPVPKKHVVALEIAQRELKRAKTAYRVKRDRLNELFSKVELYRKWLQEQGGGYAEIEFEKVFGLPNNSPVIGKLATNSRKEMEK